MNCCSSTSLAGIPLLSAAAVTAATAVVDNFDSIRKGDENWGRVPVSLTQMSFDPLSVPDMMDDDSGWAEDESASNVVDEFLLVYLFAIKHALSLIQTTN